MARMTEDQLRLYLARQLLAKRPQPSPAQLKAEAQQEDERQLQEDIAQYLRLKQIPFFRQRMDRKTTSTVGQPDFLACVNGRFTALEAKVGTRTLTDEQKAAGDAIERAGGAFHVVRSLQEAMEVLKTLDAGDQK